MLLLTAFLLLSICWFCFAFGWVFIDFDVLLEAIANSVVDLLCVGCRLCD